jgi:hypothetical protein
VIWWEGMRAVRQFRRWVAIKFGTRRTPHPWGRPQISRRAWWDRGKTFSSAASSYEEAEANLTAWMDQAAAEAR